MHIINKLIALLLFVVFMAYLPVKFASLLACFVIVWSGLQANLLFHALTKKIKWVLFFMAFVLCLSTPGQYLFNSAPLNSMAYFNLLTFEGLFLAALHTLKLLAMVAAIALLLHTTPKQKLIAGFYQLGQYVISHVYLKRFVVRLWLVLYYFEHHAIKFNRIQDLHLAFAQTLPDDEHLENMTLNLQPFTLLDVLALILLIACFFISLGWFKWLKLH